MAEGRKLIEPELSMFVSWLECPGSIYQFGQTRIRGVSPCSKYVLLDWIRHPVPIAHLAIAGEPKLAYPDRGNEWGEDGIDRSTGENLIEWVKQHQ